MTLIMFPRNEPCVAALDPKTGKAMDVILHIGAHRCATTSFQNYLRQNSKQLLAQGTGFWGPRRTRNGMFSGLAPGQGSCDGRDRQRRSIARVALNLGRSQATGVDRLMISDENMLGSVRQNLRMGDLYSGVGERIARYAMAFGDRLSDVVLNVRSLDDYWSSALTYGVVRGRSVPNASTLERLAGGPRSWRDVVTDVAHALPGVRIRVLPFESFGGHPDKQFQAISGQPAPGSHTDEWLNASLSLPQLRAWLGSAAARALPEGNGRWQPFNAEQLAMLREIYADDMMWLVAGADGLAQLVENTHKKRTGLNPPNTDKTRGRRYDDDERRLAGSG